MTDVYILPKTFCIGGNIFFVKVDKFLATKYGNYSTTSESGTKQLKKIVVHIFFSTFAALLNFKKLNLIG